MHRQYISMQGIHSTISARRPYQYPPLPNVSAPIRLVVLWPAPANHHQIQCQLVCESLENNPEYEALSYAWGDDQEHREIELDGNKVMIRTNLEAALRNLRHIPAKPRVLWIDALCIDQDNLIEKSSQVQQMAKVYRTAKEVIVWLGLESNTSSLALGTALQYYNAFKKEFDSMEYTELLEYSLRSPVLTLGEKHAFLRLFERPWFSRIWIIQEVTAARRATVQCGKLQIPLNVLIRFGEYFKFSGAGNSKWNMEESRILAPIIALAGTMKSKANTRLLTCLFESYVHKATDPRDKIYAVLSRVLPTGVYASRAHLLPYPDYTLSLSDVYIRTARALIEYDQSLQLLSLAPYTQVAAYLAKDEYPSWVPIWSTPVAMLPQLNLLNDRANREVLPSSPVRVLDMAETGDILEGEDFSAGLGWSPALSFRFLKKGKILALPGVRVDEIEQRDSGMPLFNPERTKVWFEECKTAFLGRDPWSDQMSSTREAFWRTCVVYDNIYLSNGAISISGMHRVTDELRGISRIPPRDRGEEDILINHISDRLKIFVESPGFMSTFDRASFPFFHRLFQTVKGNIGKGSAGAQKSDIVVVFQGAKVPHVLRKRGDHYRIIGDCYLHGIMDGEIVHQQKAGKYEFEEFLIA